MTDTNVSTINPQKASDIMEALIARGDLSKLSPDERAKYYVRVCESIGINPMTQPLAYITLNGRLVLYAKKECTDQLRSIYGVSITELTERERDGVFTVIARVRDKTGRDDMATGAVHIDGLRGENLANAMMKAETKAKRRATLSICGLGFLDESELPTAAPFSDLAPRPRPVSAADQLKSFASSAPERGEEQNGGEPEGEPAADPIMIAHKRGQQAREAGLQRRAMPGEYRALDRIREAQAWTAGFDDQSIPEGTD